MGYILSQFPSSVLGNRGKHVGKMGLENERGLWRYLFIHSPSSHHSDHSDYRRRKDCKRCCNSHHITYGVLTTSQVWFKCFCTCHPHEAFQHPAEGTIIDRTLILQKEQLRIRDIKEPAQGSMPNSKWQHWNGFGAACLQNPMRLSWARNGPASAL